VLADHTPIMTKNDNFRLIFVSKSVLIPKQIKETFDLHIIDETKIE